MNGKLKDHKIKRAVIPVAGFGTRMLPLTKEVPKELLPVFDRPIIEHVISEAISAGITEIIFIIREGKEVVKNYFVRNKKLENFLKQKNQNTVMKNLKHISSNIKIYSINQKKPLGLGHAVLCAKPLLKKEPFALLLPDVLVQDKLNLEKNFSFKKMMIRWDKSSNGQIMIHRVPSSKVKDYGIVGLENNEIKSFFHSKIESLIEKPSEKNAPSNLAIIGRYILPYSILDTLENTKKGHNNEIQLTDALQTFKFNNDLEAFLTSAQVFDCGNKWDLLAANLSFGMRNKDGKAFFDKFLRQNVNL